VELEWDPKKAAENLRKHEVSFNEAATVFGDYLSVSVADPAHSSVEYRYIIVGTSTRGRALLVCYTERGGRTRLISARRLTASEKRDYEENQE
jgi:uncharacterized DUF497 family protein